MIPKSYMSPNRLKASIKFIKAKSADHFAETMKLNRNTIYYYLNEKTPIRRHVAEHIYCLETLKHVRDLLRKTNVDIRVYLTAWDREKAMKSLADAQNKIEQMAKYIEEKHLPDRRYAIRGIAKRIEKETKLPPKPLFNVPDAN